MGGMPVGEKGLGYWGDDCQSIISTRHLNLAGAQKAITADCSPSSDLNWTLKTAPVERRTAFMKQLSIGLRHGPD